MSVLLPPQSSWNQKEQIKSPPCFQSVGVFLKKKTTEKEWGERGEKVTFTVQEVFSQETYGRTSWGSVAAAVGGFYFQPPPFFLFVCLFLGLIGALPRTYFSKNDSRVQ